MKSDRVYLHHILDMIKRVESATCGRARTSPAEPAPRQDRPPLNADIRRGKSNRRLWTQAESGGIL